MSAASATVCADSALGDLRPGEDWGADHDQELAFQKQKLRDRKIDAFQENSLLPCEADEHLRRDAAAKSKKRIADHQARVRKMHRDRCILQGASREEVLREIHGAFVFVDSRCRGKDIASAFRTHGLKITTSCQASVFVVRRPCRAPLL